MIATRTRAQRPADIVADALATIIAAVALTVDHASTSVPLARSVGATLKHVLDETATCESQTGSERRKRTASAAQLVKPGNDKLPGATSFGSRTL